MEGSYIYPGVGVEAHSPSLAEHQADTVKEGDLTDDYIVNMMHEFSIESSQHDSYNFQPYKLYDAGVLSIATELTPGLLGVPDQRSTSPAMVNALKVPEELMYQHSPGYSPYSASGYQTTEQHSPSYSPYSASGYQTSEGHVEEEIINSPKYYLPGSQTAQHLVHSPEQNLYGVVPTRSPADLSEDNACSEPLPECSYSLSDQSWNLPTCLPTRTAVASKRVGDDLQDPPKKKRGRKPRSEAEKAEALARRKMKTAKVKQYEIDQPYEDKELERKRINAVNSKRHRDQQKQIKMEMEEQLADVTIERDILKQENMELRRKLDAALDQIQAFQRYFGVQSVPSESIP